MALNRLYQVLIGIFFLIVNPLFAQEVLTSIASVRALSMEQAARHLPVEVEATVILIDWHSNGRKWSGNGLFVQDGGEGIYLYQSPVDLTNRTVRVGDRLHISAVTDAGLFCPVLNCQSLSIKGAGEMPKPLVVSAQNLFSPDLDCRWSQVSGVIVSAEADDETQYILTLELYGWNVKILIPWSREIVGEVARLMQQRVSIQGVASTVFNRQRQMTGRYFYVPSLNLIQRLKPDAAEKPAALVSVDHLLRSDRTTEDVVKVRGVVTHALQNELCLRGEGGSLRVFVADGGGFHPGDRVEVEGFAAIAPFRPIVRARHVTLIRHEAAPSPVDLAKNLTNLVGLEWELVATEAEFLGATDNPEVTTLHCRTRDRFFEAVLPKPNALASRLAPNCLVRLVGTCELTTTRPLPRSEWVDGFRIHLRSAEDLTILHRPSWWTSQRLLTALALAVGLGIIAQIWILMLRRQVAAQTRIIGTQIKRESTLGERQRIARALHDTLEQQMTGVAIQLGTVEERFDHSPDKARASLRLARKMVRYCCEEANRVVRDLRSVLLERVGLVGALQEALPPLTANCDARFVFEALGTPVDLDGVVETHLLYLAQEAVANAATHAAAAEIKVSICYTPDCVTLTVKDDGRGFDVDVSPARGHFGLIGMQERANKLDATLSLESASGKGTSVIVKIPIGREPESLKFP